jgi:predicted enzyme related to lactoylglutathione lyase
MTRPVHFEIHASDPAALAEFYAKAFDWKVNHIPQMNYWLLDTGLGDGINGGLMQRHGPKPAPGQSVNAFVLSLDVPSVDEYQRRALDAGAVVALPKMAIPGVGWQIYIRDPDDNILGLHQRDPAAH